MPHSSHHAPSVSAPIAYGMGSAPRHTSASTPSAISAQSASASGFAVLPSTHVPPPNRARDLDFSRFESFQRKGEALGYIEELLLVWLRDQARYTLDPDVDLPKLNLASRILYRLTAIQKTMLAIDAILDSQRKNQPAPPVDENPDPDPGSAGILPASSPVPKSDSATSSSNSPEPRPEPSAIPSPSTNPADASSLEARTSTSAAPLPPANSATAATNPPNPSSPITAPPVTASTHDSNTSSALPFPHVSVRGVAVCPTLSLESIDACLDQTESDLAQILHPATSTPDPESPISHQSHPSPSPSLSPSPRSAIPTPSCSASCVQCAEPFCASRQAVPFHHPGHPLKSASHKCDGTCRICSRMRTCPFTPAYLRSG